MRSGWISSRCNAYAGLAGYLVGAMHKQVWPDIQLYQYISVLPMYTKGVAGV